MWQLSVALDYFLTCPQNLIQVHTTVQSWTEFNAHSVLNRIGATQIMTELRSVTNLNSVQAESALVQQVSLKWCIVCVCVCVCVCAPGGSKLLLVQQNQKDSPHSFHDKSSNKPSVGYSAAECKNTKKTNAELKLITTHMSHKANNIILPSSILVQQVISSVGQTSTSVSMYTVQHQ